MELFKSRTRVAYTNAVGDKVYPVIVDIKRGIKSTEEIQFMSSDINTGILSVAFIQGNENYNVSGAEVVCSVMRPDASTLDIPCTIVENNIVEVPLGINGTSQDGIYSFDFKVFKGGNKVVGTPIMNYSVSLSISNDNAVLEDDRLPVLTMLITQVNELNTATRETINQANTATEATREATAKAIEATNKANETVNKVTQDTANAIAEVNATSDTMVENVNNAISNMDTTVNNKISEMTDTVNDKISEVDTAKNDMINDVSSTKANMVNEVTNAKNEMTNTVTNKVNEVEGRFNALTASQQQSSEVIDARDGETSLKARLDRDIEKAKQIYVNVEGSHISTDSYSGYAKNVEILGNTVQDASNLADIRSVGDTIEGQELYEIPVVSTNENLFRRDDYTKGGFYDQNGFTVHSNAYYTEKFINIKGNTKYYFLDKNNTGKPVNYVTFYNKNKEFIKMLNEVEFVFTPSTAFYMRISPWEKLIEGENPLCYIGENNKYEPYVEDKLTILSPVQLEKVGDVADRIIEKDGVWGVDKNVIDYEISGEESIGFYTNGDTDDLIGFSLRIKNLTRKSYITISNKFKPNPAPNTSARGIHMGNDGYMYIRVTRSELKTEDVAGFRDFIKGTFVKYQTTQPQFIPLPHSQQVKLRTFANKTNISFGCDIEGTIKAQVPKSLGATVNTHTTQISNLNKELDRVKKLEESTVSTVTTESDFTTVEQTSNGYFEDVKLEGKTLVNIMPFKTYYWSGGTSYWSHTQYVTYDRLIPGEEYTIICFGNVPDFRDAILGHANYANYNQVRVNKLNAPFKFTAINKPEDGRLTIIVNKNNSNGFGSNDLADFKVVLLEGDHTQNPPSYFEGLKSVGQSATTSEDGADEIVVSSVNENLLDLTGGFDILPNDTSKATYTFSNNSLTIKSSDWVSYYGHIIPVKKGKLYYSFDLSYNAIIRLADANRNTLLDVLNDFQDTVKTKSGFIDINFDGYVKVLYLYRTADGKEGIISNAHISQSVNEYTSHKSDKKRLLYYNDETQSWEKPVLRQWDSIEKHADGKYYYHQRSGEVVLNGSETYTYVDSIVGNDVLARFYLFASVYGFKKDGLIVCDKFSYGGTYVTEVNGECIGTMKNDTFTFKIKRDKLSTQDVNGFKQWLQANPTTVVYQLAQEKVYECTNIDLITYSGETNYIVNCGAISPKTILKVHNNISNVVKILQEKVSLLENKFIEGLKQVLAGDMYSLAELLYPEDFVEENPENNIMLLPLE